MRGRLLTDTEVDATRRRLVDVARALVQAEGRDACTLRRVAAEAGMSRSTPYTYFVDKEALLDAVRAAALHALSDRCEGALATAADLAGRVRALGQAYLDFAFEHPAWYDLIFESHGAGPEHLAAAARYRALADGPLAEARAAGLSTLPPDRLGAVLWAATHGLIALRRAGKVDAAAFDTLLADVRDTLAFGFVPRAGAS
jgi:AcrR family transcriptional regulator